MSAYSNEMLVEMAYRYLVEGKIQRTIEAELNLPTGTISDELKVCCIIKMRKLQSKNANVASSF